VAAELFVDTSGWHAIVAASDPYHDPVAAVLRERLGAGARVVTTNLVLAETHALLLRRLHRPAALTFLRSARERPNVVVTSTTELETRAIVEWILRYDDQAFSFTDAVSFTVMAERGITEALTLDRHFRAAGFVGLPAPR